MCVSDSIIRCCSGGDEFIRLGATSAVAVIADLTLQEMHTAPTGGDLFYYNIIL